MRVFSIAVTLLNLIYVDVKIEATEWPAERPQAIKC